MKGSWRRNGAQSPVRSYQVLLYGDYLLLVGVVKSNSVWPMESHECSLVDDSTRGTPGVPVSLYVSVLADDWSQPGSEPAFKPASEN